MKLSDIVVEVRDRNLARVGVIKTKDLTATVTPIHNNIGSWTVTLPKEHPLCSALRQPGSGIIVSGPNDVILSGPTTKPEFAATTDDSIGTVTFTGVSDTVILADALAWPQPSNGDAASQNVSYDDRTDVAESLMHAYVNANIGPSAPANRRNTKLTMGTNLARGTSIQKKARFPVLGDLLTELAAPDNLGFRVVQRGGGLVFETYQVRDRSTLVRLSLANDELASQKVATTPPSVTRVIVAGSGNLVGRKFIERSSADSIAAETAWGRRIEQFLDNRTTDQTTALNAAGDQVLADGGSTLIAVQAVPSDNSSQIFGRDWFLGDSISVEVDGVETAMVATGAIMVADSDGFRLGVQLGDAMALSNSSATTLSGVEARVSYLERSESAMPTGSMTDFAGIAAPEGWLICDGSAVSRTLYPNLFATIGTTFGTGDGSTTFNVPDLRNRFTIGNNPGQYFGTIGLTDGDTTSGRVTRMAHNHTHTASTGGPSEVYANNTITGSASRAGPNHTHAVTVNATETGYHPFMVVNKIIKT